MIESNGKLYVFSTGGGSKWSTDGLAWTQGVDLFPHGLPQSMTSVVPNDEGVWAPDAIYLNGQYYIYYALANAQNACAVGLVTTPTLDSSSPDYKLTDRGVIVSNPGSATFCAIDPCPALDASGNLWLSFGSGYTKPSSNETIYLMRLDNATGLPAAGQAAPGTPLQPGHIEASYVYYHAGYYYLFWNSGGCCSGAASTYEIHVARSQAITGPYTGAQIFLQSAGAMHGPGQIGIYDQCGADRFTYHYYPDTGGSVLGENELTWSSSGWPVAGPSSTTPLTLCGQPDGGGGGGSLDASADASGTGVMDGDIAPTDDVGAPGDDAGNGNVAEADAAAGSSSSGGAAGGSPSGGSGSPTGGGTGRMASTSASSEGTGSGSREPTGGCTFAGPGPRDLPVGVVLTVGIWAASRRRARAGSSSASRNDRPRR
jgi:hypothetical protein